MARVTIQKISHDPITVIDGVSNEMRNPGIPGSGGMLCTAVLLGCLVISGCAQLSSYHTDHVRNGEGGEQLTGVDIHSSYPAVRRNSFEGVNILELVDPNNERKTLVDNAAKATPGKDLPMSAQYDLAFAAFRLRQDNLVNPKHVHRNAVQDRILAVSTSRCNVFKTYLRRQQADSNFLLGSLTTVSGVLGAVLPGATASRNLAGAAGFFSGLQAEYSSAYFSNLAAHVIIQGIESRQKRMLDELITRRANLSIEQYSMEAAVRDAIQFDGSCSTIVGLQEAGEAIKDVTNPGLNRAAELIAQAKVVRKILEADNIQDLKKSGELDELLKQSQPKTAELVVSAAQSIPRNLDIGEQITRVSGMAVQLELLIKALADELQQSYYAAYAELIAVNKPEKYTGLGTYWGGRLNAALGVGLTECTTKVFDSSKSLAATRSRLPMKDGNAVERIKMESELLSNEAAFIASVKLSENYLKVASDLAREMTKRVSVVEEIRQAKPENEIKTALTAIVNDLGNNAESLKKSSGCNSK